MVAGGVVLGATAIAIAVGAQGVMDMDGDGVPDDVDNCVLFANGPGGACPSQLDIDLDGYGNACDLDVN